MLCKLRLHRSSKLGHLLFHRSNSSVVKFVWLISSFRFTMVIRRKTNSTQCWYPDVLFTSYCLLRSLTCSVSHNLICSIFDFDMKMKQAFYVKRYQMRLVVCSHLHHECFTTDFNLLDHLDHLLQSYFD